MGYSLSSRRAYLQEKDEMNAQTHPALPVMSLRPTPDTGQRLILSGVSWVTYERLLADFSDSHAAPYAAPPGYGNSERGLKKPRNRVRVPSIFYSLVHSSDRSCVFCRRQSFCKAAPATLADHRPIASSTSVIHSSSRCCSLGAAGSAELAATASRAWSSSSLHVSS